MSKILIAVPTYDHNIDADCFKSIYGLSKAGHEVMFDYVKGYNAARARSMMALEALQYNFDYLLSVDADMILPYDTIPRLMEVQGATNGIVFGWYHRRQYGVDNSESFIWREGERNFGEHNNLACTELAEASKPIRVCASGLGCALIPTIVFTIIKRPWFDFVDYNTTLEDNPRNTLDDSTSFCAKASAMNIEMWVDPLVHVKHITSILL